VVARRKCALQLSPGDKGGVYRRDVTKTQSDSDVEVRRHVAETAARLHDRLPELASAMHSSLEDQIPELRGDERVTELLGPSVEGNVDTILRALRYGIDVKRIEAPTAAFEYARRLAQHGVPVNALVRAYRLGQRVMNELIFGEVRVLDISDQTRYAVIEMVTATLFEYIDWISQQIVAVYEDERERWLENQNSLRALRVREVLAATRTADVDAASTSIRYSLRWHHLALVMWYPDATADGNELGRLQRFLRDVGEAVGAGGPTLFVAADRACGWGWLPFRAISEQEARDVPAKVREFARTRPDCPSVAIGTMAGGVDGFRQSHREAESARRVAMVGKREPVVVAAADPGLAIASLLSGSSSTVADTRAWVAKVLGDLASDEENDERLRETLRVFLGCGSSYKLAAEELNLHSNSVKYRVGRAVVRRGREIDTDRLDVELALLVCHWYGAAVLQPGAQQKTR
jgi:DNA-binding PucR family transcriptional regulator